MTDDRRSSNAVSTSSMRPLKHFTLWRLGLAAPETQTTAAERAALADLADGRRRLVEIGVWHGVTTARLRQAMAADGVLFAVDPFPRGRLGVSLQQPIARAEVNRIRRGAVRWLRMTGAEAAARHVRTGEPPVDFIFIDGDHTFEGLQADWLGWRDLVAPGGLVALHDSHPTPDRPIDEAGSVRYTREVILRDPAFHVLRVVDTLTVVERPSASGE